MILNKQLCLTAVILISVLLWSSCKKCSDSNGNTYNVDQADLPYIIPYTDSSKVRFLKNGIDTLTFISQGLKNTYISQNVPGDGCSQTDKLQQFSLKMKCSENEFFEITEKADLKISYYLNNQEIYNEVYTTFYSYGNLSTEFLDSILINGYKYDSVYKIKNSYGSYIILKEKLGLLQYKSNNNIYIKLSN